MPANSKKEVNNMKPPKEAVESAVGSDFTVAGVDMQQQFKEIDKRPKTVILNTVEREVLSTQLTEGMRIKVENEGDRENQNYTKE